MRRIILVHGSCHGAWCWYKVVAMLRTQGYAAAAIDLAACGADPRRLPQDVSSFDEYTRPLMDLVAAVPDGEKVVLVGHMFGGLSLASVMDAFPEKVAAAVFLSGMMPDTTHAPSYIDLTLASMMIRPTSLFYQELSKKPAFSKEGYGSVDKIYIICEDDAAIDEDFQQWMIENNPVKEVMKIRGADHMAMLSKPKELCECIKSIVKKYAN
ncbi:Methylesterase 3 [Platanthera zijinensis]|uniref:Methylesterase 3 n=1 Tax=Platanthera zijinensis TaxID=2320716 RepID=A0AAP0BUY0_9ASPA